MKRTSALIVVGAALLLGACQDLGLPGNIPAEEARRAPPSDLVAEVIRPVEAEAMQLVMDGRLWVPSGRPRAMDPDQLRPVGSAAGRTVYGRTWDERPYGALFVRLPAADPAAAGTAREAMEARLEQWQEFAPVIGQQGRQAGPGPARPPEPGP